MLTTLKQYQAWRTGEDGRTMEEIGMTPKKISEALEWAIDKLEGVDGANDCSRGIDAVEEALAAHRKQGGEA